MQKLAVAILSGFLLIGVVFHGFVFQSEALGIVSVTIAVLLFTLFIPFQEFKLSLFNILVIGYVISYIVTICIAKDQEQAIASATQMMILIPIMTFSKVLKKDFFVPVIKVLALSGSFESLIGIVFNMFRNQRLESTFQYANALAIFLLISGLCSILLSTKNNKWKYWIFLSITLTGLMLTYSRAVWIIWGISILAMFGSIPRIRNASMMKKIFIVHTISLLASIVITKNPLFFLGRIASITPEASELQLRFTYWKDAFDMYLHYPLGVGAGGWSVLLPEFRTKAYYVVYVHNHFLQVALDAGTFGILLFFGLLIVFYLAVWKSIKKWHELDSVRQGIPIIVTALLLHAGFDFDFSFPILLGIVFFLMTVFMEDNNQVMILTVKKLPLSLRAVVAVPLIVTLGFSIYLTLIYGKKEIAQNVMQEAPEEAAKILLSLEKWVPWSNSIPYEAAKAYVLQGNRSGDVFFYKKAQEQIDLALAKTPRQELYQELSGKLVKYIDR
jgi:O-antigen ligase